MAAPPETVLLEQVAQPVRDKLRAALELIDSAAAPRACNLAMREALAAAGFPKRGQGAVPRFSELSPSQRAFAQILGHRPEATRGEYALPSGRWTARWLGLTEPGVLERSVSLAQAGADVPLWHALAVTARAEWSTLFRRLGLPIAERLEAFADLATGAYDLNAFDLVWGDLAEIDGSLGAWAAETADRIVVEKLHCNVDLRWPVFLSLVRASVPIEPRWDELLPAAPDRRRLMRECALAVPGARRTPAIVAAVRRLAFPRSVVDAGLGLLPDFPSAELTQLILDHGDGADAGPNRLPKAELSKLLDAIGVEQPVVASTVERFRRDAPPVPELRVVYTLAPTEVDDLTDQQRKQVRQAGCNYDGQDVTAEDRLRKLGPEESEESSFRGLIELFTIADHEDVHRYDAWLYMGDSGSIFRARTTETVAHIIQGHLEHPDEGLREALRTAIREARRARTKR